MTRDHDPGWVHPANRGAVVGFDVNGSPFMVAIFDLYALTLDEAKADVDAAPGLARRRIYASDDPDLEAVMARFREESLARVRDNLSALT